MDVRLERPADSSTLDQRIAGTMNGRGMESEDLNLYELSIAESPSRFQVRSMSMPVIKALGENTSAGTVKSELPQKCRHELRLPSFKSLGIAVPHPDHLLTPPEEPDHITWHPHSQPLPYPRDSSIPRSLPESAAKMTPEDERAMAAPHDSEAMDTERTRQTTFAEPLEVVEEDPAMRPSSSSSEEGSPGGPVWLEHAIDAIVSTVPATGPTSNVVVTLCHTQPCPLSTNDGVGPSAFNPIISALQGKLEQGQCIEITYAVPPKFNMLLLPKSPAATPGITSMSGEVDYFSMNIFSKAVVAVEHSAAINSSVPSSPRPVVPPSTVGITCLERFIPPSTTEEYNDLFSTDGPSVLVDRLTELSPNDGKLIFIYPTNLGASTFTSKYLNPLLDPLLRTMIQIHGLSADVGSEVGTMAAVHKMLAFEQMTRRINILFRKLSRTTQGSAAQHPKFTLVQSSKEVVQLDRDVWMEWWLHQETARIKEVMRRYFKRGLRLPQSKEKSESALVWEILDGVSARTYASYDAPREGIEVGVFVIKRTA